MTIHEIVRAWKDTDYRASLSDTQRAALPAHPVGAIELDVDDLEVAAGGTPHNSSQARCTPLFVCHSALSEPTCGRKIVWG
jgi:mersacidin/lichenicidin family type 2 lantibiotic